MNNQWLFLMSTLAVAYCRPQYSIADSSAVEVEKQQVVEIHPDARQLFQDSPQRHIEENTKAILEKIAQVNEKHGLNRKKTKPAYQPFPDSYLRSQEHRQSSDFKFPRNPFTNPILDYIEGKNAEAARTPYDPVDADDEIPGQFIKRKIVHQQTVMVPMSAGFMPQPYPMQMTNNQTDKNELEKMTVENIKNIVGNSQVPQGVLFNPYNQQQQGAYGYYAPYLTPDYRLYGPYTAEQFLRPGRQWQSPLAQYFPIIIRDPIVQMFNAITSMVEYGPQAAQAPQPCNQPSKKPSKVSKNEIQSKARNGEAEESRTEELTTVLDIEGLQIDNAKEMQLRQAKQNTAAIDNGNKTSRQSPPIRDQQLFADEQIEDDAEKAEDVSNNNNKKFFSKDNTGSGIFIKKIKVRKGGVAIAGPGGIATAGSGGTAIVGPNGFAYTHPDSLAIAGSGTKVIAVEPSINLTDVVNDLNRNKTRGQGHTPRIGKLVAVGPVIYYNKG